MRPRTAAFRRPLDQVFAAPSHIAILRALLDSAEGMSGRQVARLAEVNHQACAVALGRLEELSVLVAGITRQEIMDRAADIRARIRTAKT